MSSNAGGAATNAGIGFQQRISALFLTHMFMDVVFIDDLGMDKNSKIVELKFESNNEIDDLVIKTEQSTILIQAKRSITCSESESSEFYKVIKQFVSQYLTNANSNDRFVLATTSKSSSKITVELKKILESIRSNDKGFLNNPLNKSEQDVLRIVKKNIASNYKDITNKPASDEVVNSILELSHVSVIDIEEGMPLEKAILILISGKVSVLPELFWSNLINIGLTLSKKRSSINLKGLEARVGKFIEQEKKENGQNNSLDFTLKGGISSGREVLIIESFSEEFDFMIVELIRFEDDGENRLSFSNNKVELKNGDEWNVIYRTSTFAGVERYIKENKGIFETAKVAILEINSDESVDEMNVAKSHSELCLKLINENTAPFECIICGDDISDDRSPIIEIDEIGLPHNVGLAHRGCLSPLHRILGVIDSELFRSNKNLVNFNYDKWYLLSVKGQGLFSSLAMLPKSLKPLFWKPDYNSLSKGKYCIKINLDDGSSRYVQDRGRIQRETISSAKDKSQWFNERFKAASDENNPHCYTSDSGIFTTYSHALQCKKDNESILICKDAEPVLFTRAIDKSHSVFERCYAPLMIFLDKENGLPILTNDAMIFLSNPINVDSFIRNWELAGVALPPFTVSIIESDEEFDKLIINLKKDEVTVLIDPEIDMNGQLVSGLIVEDFNDMETLIEKYS
ncbi:hypothetical protein [Vibrio sp. A14(2019)]|uniref:hypothetical protein n=1 Tax=Vibrio sp. A14(2019) TaxID=2591428 RepID=UPI0027C59551|nr:hypothetical protein [Vibrio sp. A14(2019)]MDQ2188980.1 hypothetical protein [Vibrio sp. A14(2019)]